jgi:hypothetical protein
MNRLLFRETGMESKEGRDKSRFGQWMRLKVVGGGTTVQRKKRKSASLVEVGTAIFHT